MKTGKTIKTQKGRETRERIMKCARELLAESGWSSATMEKISERAGIANCSIVWHFGSKENLFLEIFDGVVDEFEEAFDSYSFPDGDPMDMLRRFLLDYADLIEAYPEIHIIFYSYVFNGNLSGKTGDRIRVMYDGYRRMVSERLKNFIPVDPEKVASALVALIDGMFIQWYVDPNRVNIKQVFERFMNIVLINNTQR
ncbi:MAG: TetR/AcrR family transcriptional regulator [Thermodesulfobacteriota bacterium]